MCCSLLQCIAGVFQVCLQVYCSVVQSDWGSDLSSSLFHMLQWLAVCCRCVAGVLHVCCSAVQSDSGFDRDLSFNSSLH